MPRFLCDELTAHLANRAVEPDHFVFPATHGGVLRHKMFYKRNFKPAVAAAKLPPNTRFHDLRHTFASLLVALGVDPGAVMDQLGHTDPSFTLRVYRHGMRRDQASRKALRELVGLVEWSANSPQEAADSVEASGELVA